MEHYNDKFYEIHEKGSLKSSKEILPLIMNLIEPNSVIDVGCGVGTWLSTFESLGVKKILGIDGDHVNKEKLYINKDNFIVANLENIDEIREKEKNNQINKFDLAMSLEVAEHLSENVAHDFIEYLTSKSDVVLFSAAVPGQGGTNHINEQWPEYWIKIFKENDFEVVDYIRWEIWNNSNIESWYKQNIFLFVKKENLKEIVKKLPEKRNQYSIIHPDLYDWLNKVNKMFEKNSINLIIENNDLMNKVKKLEDIESINNTQIDDEKRKSEKLKKK